MKILVSLFGLWDIFNRKYLLLGFSSLLLFLFLLSPSVPSTPKLWRLQFCFYNLL